MSAHYNIRLLFDALGMSYFVILGAIAVGSLVLDVHYWGISGIVLGRLFNRNDGGGIHTLATLGVLIPSFMWARKIGLNVGIAAVAAQLTDYYHEGIWNLPYYIYYHMRLDQVPYYFLMAAACLVFYGTVIYAKREHNFRHLLYLLPWFGLITAYLLLVGHYSEDLFGPQAYYSNVWVNLWEVFEVNLFAWSLYLGITAKTDGHPVLATVYRLPQKAPELFPVEVTVKQRSLGEFFNLAFSNPTFWVVFVEICAAYLFYQAHL